MKQQGRFITRWHPILFLKEWWTHRQLLKAQKIYDRALRNNSMPRRERRQMIREAGSFNLAMGSGAVLIDLEALSKEDRSIIEAMIARQSGQQGAQRGQLGASTDKKKPKP